MYQGRIVKGIGGFYYVNTDIGLVECKPRGIFRKESLPQVGIVISLLKEALAGSYRNLPRKTR